MIELSQWDPAKARRRARNVLPPGLEHAKELKIILSEWTGGPLEYRKGDNQYYTEFILAMVRAMPNLQSFMYVHCLAGLFYK